jgi:hypothetical protein
MAIQIPQSINSNSGTIEAELEEEGEIKVLNEF